jgi:hypothetical protein
LNDYGLFPVFSVFEILRPKKRSFGADAPFVFLDLPFQTIYPVIAARCFKRCFLHRRTPQNRCFLIGNTNNTKMPQFVNNYFAK